MRFKKSFFGDFIPSLNSQRKVNTKKNGPMRDEIFYEEVFNEDFRQ
jgi:hypothetical protein